MKAFEWVIVMIPFGKSLHDHVACRIATPVTGISGIDPPRRE